MLRKRQIRRWLFGARPEGHMLGIVSVAFVALGFISFFMGAGAIFGGPSAGSGGGAFVIMGVILIVLGAWGRKPSHRTASGAEEAQNEQGLGSLSEAEQHFSQHTMQAILELARTTDREFFDAVVDVARFDASHSDALNAMIDENCAAFDSELALESEWFGELSQERWESRRVAGLSGLNNLLKDQIIPDPTRRRPHKVSATFEYDGETFAMEITSNWNDVIGVMISTRLTRVLTNPAIKAIVLMVPANNYKRASRAIADSRIIVVADNSIEFIPQMIDERFADIADMFATAEISAADDGHSASEDSLPSRRSARLAG